MRKQEREEALGEGGEKVLVLKRDVNSVPVAGTYYTIP